MHQNAGLNPPSHEIYETEGSFYATSNCLKLGFKQKCCSNLKQHFG